MSRSYSVRIPVEILIPQDEMSKNASFSLVFTMLEILSRDKMNELLRDKLLEKGFLETERGLEMQVADQRSAVFDLESLSMKLEVPLPNKCKIFVEEEYLTQFKEKIAKAIESQTLLEDLQVGRQVDSLKAIAVNELKDMAIQSKKQVNSALKDVYRQAVKEKASALGNVENISESKDGNTYRIRIEIST
jgi:hypothetical protein